MEPRWLCISVTFALLQCGSFSPVCKYQLDIVSVLDGSGSISFTDFRTLKEAIIDLVDNLNLGVYDQWFGAVVYSSRVSDVIAPSYTAWHLKSRISSIVQPRGGTATHLGIKAMSDMLQSQGRTAARKVGIVITDGRSNSFSETKKAADNAKSEGITMFAVGVGGEINADELRVVASSSSNVIQLDDFDELLKKIQALIDKICVVHGGWSEWSGWISSGICSQTCGGGLMIHHRTRTCTNPAPSENGKPCIGSPGETKSVACNTQECIVDGGWSSWSPPSYGPCSQSCGGGTRTVTETRTCSDPEPSPGGKNCSGQNTQTYTETCNTNSCPENDGGWSGWSGWISSGSCSQTCGGGFIMHQRKRTCTRPTPSENGKPCVGSSSETKSVVCNSQECVVDGGWSGWSGWISSGICSQTCGGGLMIQHRTRTCTNPAPSENGKPCVGSPGETKSVACNTQECVVDGGWSSWSPPSYGPCSQSCGGGTRTVTQTRTCSDPEPSPGGEDCPGQNTQTYTETCNTNNCPDLCDGCKYENGVGFLPHPTDCRFFIQCVHSGSSHFIKPCPAGLHWSQKHLTCTFPSDSDCVTTATSAPMLPAQVTTLPSTSTGCNSRSVPRDPNSYQQMVPGAGWTTMMCAPGTIYHQESCGCIAGESPDVSDECQDELYLPMSRDVKDYSGNNLYVQNQDVTHDTQGYARFVTNSTVIVPRFANFGFGNTLRISFLLRNIPSAGQAEAVVSNAACGHPGSIYITRTPSTVEFSVVNQDNVVSTLSVPMSSVVSSVRLEVNEGIVSGNVNGVVKKVAFKGQIKKVHCGLQIGSATGLQNFTGRLKEFKLALCIN